MLRACSAHVCFHDLFKHSIADAPLDLYRTKHADVSSSVKYLCASWRSAILLLFEEFESSFLQCFIADDTVRE